MLLSGQAELEELAGVDDQEQQQAEPDEAQERERKKAKKEKKKDRKKDKKEQRKKKEKDATAPVVVGPRPTPVLAMDRSGLTSEGRNMSHFIASGKRIPRRGEIGRTSEEISSFEAQGYVMSGSRHRRMEAVRQRKESQVRRQTSLITNCSHACRCTLWRSSACWHSSMWRRHAIARLR
jgi:hypothetical protein